jgi:prepilin-type N-terminal cleavage/methylation domain-containing protein
MTGRVAARQGLAVARHSSRGLTLVEMLVSLAIATLAVALVWQFLFQAMRIERNLASTTLQAQTVGVRVEWVRTLLEALLPLPRSDEGHFRGNSSLMQGFSTETPGWPDSAAGRFSLALEFDERRQVGRLVLRSERSATVGREEGDVMLQWEGQPGAFTYLGPDGKWAAEWEPPANPREGMRVVPLSVAIRTGSTEWPVIMASPRTTGELRTTRRETDKL